MLPLARISWFILWTLLIPLSSHSQSVELTYTVFHGVNNAPDTVRVYAQSMDQQTVSIRAVNISIVFDGGKSNLLGYNSSLNSSWSPLFERDRIDSVSKTYWGNTYQQRWNYGIGDALVTPSSLVMIPPDTATALLLLELRFQRLGSGLVYVENQTENPVNQIGDSSFRQLAYQVRALPGTFPVVWTDFSVDEDVQEGVLLSWETASELNNDFFVIESSTNQDFSLFEELGKKEGKGTTAESQQYRFMDERAGEGKRYYRIRQVDIDGAFTYSNIVDVFVEMSAFQVQIYQLQSNDHLRIRIFGVPKDGLILAILNTSGQTIWTEQPNTAGRRNVTITLPATQFNRGVFLLRAASEGQRSVERVKSFILR